MDSLDWTAIIYSSFVSVGAFGIISLCYRMDYAIAHPDELLVGPPDVKVTVADAIEVTGTRISYKYCRSGNARPRFRKPYFHVAVWGWLMSYVVVATLKVAGYIECSAESAGLIALYVLHPLICFSVLLCSVVRGEVKKVWGYCEDWARDPASTVPATTGEQHAQNVGEVQTDRFEEKLLLGEVNEKGLVEA